MKNSLNNLFVRNASRLVAGLAVISMLNACEPCKTPVIDNTEKTDVSVTRQDKGKGFAIMILSVLGVCVFYANTTNNKQK